MLGNIFDIKRFAVHDGPGIRTTVFFKGCTLKCVWCHNPEGLSGKRQLGYYANKCVNCGRCASVCEYGAHNMNPIHTLERSKCTLCGKCVDSCLNSAIVLYGRNVESKHLLSELLQDVEFYESTNGGVTLSGGECLVQADFCSELLSHLKKEGIHTAVDTCGFIPQSSIEKVIPYTDLFLYDIKAFDENVHIACTGKSNKTILENLKYIDSCGKKIEIRFPYVPDYNSSEVEKIADFVLTLKNVTEIRVLSYHNYAASKYSAFGVKNTLPEKIPENSEIEKIQSILEGKGLNVLQ